MNTEQNFSVKLVRKPIKAKSDNWQETASEWEVKLYGESFKFYTGSGLVTNRGTPKPPTADDVLYSLIWDATAAEQTFEQWCDEFGSNPDSIKALETYRLCQQNANKLIKAGVNLGKERERLADY